MDVEIRLLGEFGVAVDGTAVPEGAWSRRQAAALVKLLALAPGRRMLRDQVLEALWPDVRSTAAPRLHKAAHYARRALGGEESSAVVLRDDLVCLLPTARVSVDVDRFRAAASAALAARSAEQASGALALWSGPLLPRDLYEAWTAQDRADLDLLHRSLLDLAGRWEELVRLDPTDEAAHLHLVREHERRGDVRAALRQFERLDQALRHELGTTPSPEAEAVRRRLLAIRPQQPPAPPSPGGSRRLVGRRDAGDVLRRVFGESAAGRGRTVVVSGAPGIGKSAVLDLAASLASRRGWRTGRGTASVIEGLWPYAPVLEALADLCRQHPVLLDGLDDRYREEIDRALSGHETPGGDAAGTAHQRLFVAAAELVRLAAAGHGLLLVVDDVHEADEASLRLLHYLSRVVSTERVVVALAGRPGRASLEELRAGLASRGLGERIDLAPLNEDAGLRLIADRYPELDEARARRIHAASGGVPFLALELARSDVEGGTPVVDVGLSPAARRTFQRIALLGMSFSTDELIAVADAGVDEAYAQLDEALGAVTVEPAETGYRFRHALVREGLRSAMPASERRAAHHDLAVRLATLPGATPGRIAHHYLAAGEPAEAVPYVLPFVRTAGALGAYRDALTLVDAVLDHAVAQDRGHLLARRGDLLLALGDPEAISAYRDAVPATTGTEHRLVRARLGRVASFTGDVDLARSSLDGLELEGDEADAQLLLAQGAFAYVTGDLDAAMRASSTARDLLSPADLAQVGHLVVLQGLIAHQRGEWFEQFRRELMLTRGRPEMAVALFDVHLCVAEYVLYGRMPYAQVVALALELRQRSERAGALRGVAFATALIGEAALLRGDLEQAERELLEAADLHRDTDAPSGEAHSLQRLAEVRVAQGRQPEARDLLRRALPLARWSVMSMHLLQRVYGTMIIAAPDPQAARLAVDEAEAALGESDWCPFCTVALEVPAVIACADVGDVEEALRHLAAAEESAARWDGEAWPAALAEARAHIARAQGDHDEAERLWALAAETFDRAEQPLDAARCRRAGRRVPELAKPGQGG